MLAVGLNPGFSSGGWPANNRAEYYPITLPAGFTVSRFMVTNGNATGNIDIGLYDASGSRLLSTGTQSRTGSSVVQYYTVTAQAFPPGNYYLALVVSSTSGNVFAAVGSSAINTQCCGVLQEALGGTTLPTSMTPARVASPNGWHFGFTQSATL